MYEDLIITIKIDEVYGGFAESDGVMKLSEDSIIFEMQTKDSLFGAIKSGIREFRIPVKEIHMLDLKKNVFRCRLQLRFKSLKVLRNFPGSKGSELLLKIPRHDRQAAAEFVSSLNLIISEKKLEEIDNQKFRL